MIHLGYRDMWSISLWVSQLTMAILAGNIIACERADRSAEFLAYQGASQKIVISSKLIICSIAYILICTMSFFLSILILPWPEFEGTWEVQVIAYVIGFCFFGSAWLLSALLSSPAIAVGLSLMAPFIIGFSIGGILYYFQWGSDNTFGILFITINVGIGITSLITGTWHFIRSKEA
jgi:hypothetical protein